MLNLFKLPIPKPAEVKIEKPIDKFAKIKVKDLNYNAIFYTQQKKCGKKKCSCGCKK